MLTKPNDHERVKIMETHIPSSERDDSTEMETNRRRKIDSSRILICIGPKLTLSIPSPLMANSGDAQRVSNRDEWLWHKHKDLRTWFEKILCCCCCWRCAFRERWNNTKRIERRRWRVGEKNLRHLLLIKLKVLRATSRWHAARVERHFLSLN